MFSLSIALTHVVIGFVTAFMGLAGGILFGLGFLIFWGDVINTIITFGFGWGILTFIELLVGAGIAQIIVNNK